MLTLDTKVTAALAGNDIWPVRLIKIEIGETTYRISDHYKDLTIGTEVYIPNGTFLAIDDIKNAVETDDDSIEVSLSAIDNTFRKDVLAADSIGGEVTVYRGLIDPSTGVFIAQPIVAYKGIIFSVGISEEVPDTPGTGAAASTFTASVEVRALTFRLSETPGRLTNDASQKQVDSTDNSMSFVAGLNGVNVRFGGVA